MTPEQKSRQQIDRQLEQAGWTAQDYSVLLERLRASQSDHDTKNKAKNTARPGKRKKSERLVGK